MYACSIMSLIVLLLELTDTYCNIHINNKNLPFQLSLVYEPHFLHQVELLLIVICSSFESIDPEKNVIVTYFNL